MKIRVSLAIALLLSALTLAGCGPKAVRFPSPSGKVSQLQHDDYQSLLGIYVNAKGEVDYARWQKSAADVARLDRYLGRLSASTPKARPELFAGEQDQLSYWINLYNALVVREVVRRWPLKSVRDYRPTLGSKIDTTKGFFRDMRFVIGGKEMSLDDIEHATLRKQSSDARIHFALNCGSSSCPVLRPKAYSGDALEEELQAATVAFLNDPANVRVDVERKRITLSKIFKWYGEDFKTHARRVTKTERAGVLDFVGLFVKPELKSALQEARDAKFQIRYSDYDWGVNEGTGASALAKAKEPKAPAPTRVDHPGGVAMPAMELTLMSGERFEPASGKAIVVSIWATYCAPCRKSLPHLQALAAKHKDTLQVLAISMDDSKEKIEDFLASEGIKLDVAFGAQATAALEGQKIQSLPTELFVDSSGLLRFSLIGAASNREIDQAVTELLRY